MSIVIELATILSLAGLFCMTLNDLMDWWINSKFGLEYRADGIWYPKE